MSTQATPDAAAMTDVAVSPDMKLEVVAVPVADVDRAKQFYQRLGWRLDADFANDGSWRLVQMTPPGSSCSVMLGKGFTPVAPGSAQGTFLVVDDLEAARDQLAGLGAEVSEVFHFDGDLLTAGPQGRLPGRDPQGRSYFSFASFQDPDGNGWLLQEVTTRFLGRGFSPDVATATEVLREAETRHGAYEAGAPPHHRSEWYGAYTVARQRGRTPDDAAADAALHVERSRARAAK